MWACSFALMIGAVALSLRTIWYHAGAAKRSGFTRGIHISLGIRADLTISIIALPITYAVTAAMQCFLPYTNDVMSFIRTLHFSSSITKCIYLFHVLAGGDAHLKASLPTYPMKAFNAPPLCCIFCWPCCKRPVAVPRDIMILIFALKQFAYLAPVITLVDILVSIRKANADADVNLDKVVTVLLTASSMTAMWAFNSLRGLIAPIVERLHGEYRAVHMGSFVGFHMLAGKIIDLLLILLMWVLDLESCLGGHSFATMISGFLVVMVSFVLALKGPQMFPWNEAMYPPRSENSLPPDTVAVLQLHGVVTHEWRSLNSILLMAPGTEWCEQQRASRSCTWPEATVDRGHDDSWCKAAGPQPRSVELAHTITDEVGTQDLTHTAG